MSELQTYIQKGALVAAGAMLYISGYGCSSPANETTENPSQATSSSPNCLMGKELIAVVELNKAEIDDVIVAGLNEQPMPKGLIDKLTLDKTVKPSAVYSIQNKQDHAEPKIGTKNSTAALFIAKELDISGVTQGVSAVIPRGIISVATARDSEACANPTA